MFLERLERFFGRFFGTLVLLLVMAVAAFAALRVSIHGREVEVPSLAGKSDAEAAEAASDLGLHLSVENRFYSSAVPPNHVLSQLPAPGALVRRGLQVRVTESLGTQQIPVPDVTGQTEHPAEIVLKRSQLELGTVAHLPAPGPVGTILAQTPPPNSTGLDGPRVALLVADDETPSEAPAWVMPSLLGQTLASASSRLATVGLRITSATEPDLGPPQDPDAQIVGESQDPAIPPTIVAPPPPGPGPGAVIVSQSPLPGHRIAKGDPIRLTLAHHPGTDPAH